MTTGLLQERFCTRYNCAPSEFEERAFAACLYWHARLLAPFIRAVKPNFFAEDFKFIGYLGASADLREVTVDLMNFRNANLGKPSSLRNRFQLRVSGRKASKLARALFAHELQVLGARATAT